MEKEIFLYKHALSKNNADFNIWLAFPAPYSFGMSSLGYLSIFKALDMQENFNIERIFTDSKKTKIQFKNVDVIGFSISFEMDILAVFQILEKYEIPFRSKDRSEKPFIFAGGPVLTSNPEPFADFFDFILIGDAEKKDIEIMNFIRKNSHLNKKEILKQLAEFDGIYVPSLPKKNIKKSTCELTECISSPILTNESYFKNTFIIEITRGCPNRCGFCLASYLNLPVRFISYDEIVSQIETGLKYTNKIAFLGALISANPDFEKVCDYVLKKIETGKKFELSISSLRATSISPKVVQTLVKCSQKHATIAIEAGSERLRKVINKNLSEEQIMNAVKIAFENGLKGLKIYAMIGLPSETDEDIIELVELAKRIKKMYKTFDLTFSFATFIPKAHTPFEFAARQDIKSLEKKYEFINKEFAKSGIKARTSSVKWDEVQAILSQGSKNMSEYLIQVYKNGANLGAFRKIYKNFVKEKKLHKLDEIFKEKNLDFNFPWDFIKINKKELLQKEYQRLMNKK